MIEVWKEIPDFPGYDVSDWGLVRSWWRSEGPKHGRLCDYNQNPHVLKQVKSRGYCQVCLRNFSGSFTRSIHRLVLLTFVGPPPTSTHQGAHNDGVPTNNTLSNLRWATPHENAQDKRKHGTYWPVRHKIGERPKNLVRLETNAKERRWLFDQEVQGIRKLRSEGMKVNEIARLYQVQAYTIEHIILGYTWMHLPSTTQRLAPAQ